MRDAGVLSPFRVVGASLLLGLLLSPCPVHGLTVTSPANATAIINAIAGYGVVVTSAELICTNPQQAGLFEDFDTSVADSNSDEDDEAPSPTPAPVQPLLGAIIGSAYVKQAEGPNDEVYAAGSDALNGTGYAPLTDLLPNGTITKDACVLRITFTCPSGYDRVSIQYVFGSDNYPSSGNNPNEDLAGAFLNGNEPRNNIARVPDGTNDYVSVNTLYQGPSFVDNTGALFNTEMNGFTTLQDAVGDIVASGSNTLDIAIADAGVETGSSRRLRRAQVVTATDAAGSYLMLTQQCLTCISATDLTTRRGTTPVDTCAQIAGTGSGCSCAWSCMNSAIKRRCIYTGTSSGYTTYVSQVRTRIDSRYCRRRHRNRNRRNLASDTSFQPKSLAQLE
jgi:hypothetical protein